MVKKLLQISNTLKLSQILFTAYKTRNITFKICFKNLLRYDTLLGPIQFSFPCNSSFQARNH